MKSCDKKRTSDPLLVGAAIPGSSLDWRGGKEVAFVDVSPLIKTDGRVSEPAE